MLRQGILLAALIIARCGDPVSPPGEATVDLHLGLSASQGGAGRPHRSHGKGDERTERLDSLFRRLQRGDPCLVRGSRARRGARAGPASGAPPAVRRFRAVATTPRQRGLGVALRWHAVRCAGPALRVPHGALRLRGSLPMVAFGEYLGHGGSRAACRPHVEAEALG